jgi:hypothetical protein
MHLHTALTERNRALLADLRSNLQSAESFVRELREASSRFIEENARMAQRCRDSVELSRDLMRQTDAFLGLANDVEKRPQTIL